MQGDELHLVDEAASPASNASLAWKGQTCGYHVALASDEMRLEPIDSRATVQLALGSEHATIRLGRSTDQTPNGWKIYDPRVSREHAALSGSALQPPQVTAIGQHPLVLMRRGERRVLRRGEAETLEEADRLYLVDEKLTPAVGASIAVWPSASQPNLRPRSRRRSLARSWSRCRGHDTMATIA